MNGAERSLVGGIIISGLTVLLMSSPFTKEAETSDTTPNLVLSSQITFPRLEIVATKQDAVLVSPTVIKMGDNRILESFKTETPINLENIPFNYLVLKNEPVEYPNLYVITKEHPAAEPYIPMVLESTERHKDIFYLDSLIMLGLMNAESSFRPDAVSGAGAAGLMQIIPETGEGLGLRIYQGNLDIYDELKEEIGRRKTSYDRLFAAVKGESYGELERLAREYNLHQENINNLANQYRTTLLEHKDEDDRFNPKECIDAGVKYFAILADLSKGKDGTSDFRNAMAAYNCGGEAAAANWDLPPISETINYVNGTFRFYRKFRPLALMPAQVYVGEEKKN